MQDLRQSMEALNVDDDGQPDQPQQLSNPDPNPDPNPNIGDHGQDLEVPAPTLANPGPLPTHFGGTNGPQRDAAGPSNFYFRPPDLQQLPGYRPHEDAHDAPPPPPAQIDPDRPPAMATHPNNIVIRPVYHLDSLINLFPMISHSNVPKSMLEPNGSVTLYDQVLTHGPEIYMTPTQNYRVICACSNFCLAQNVAHEAEVALVGLPRRTFKGPPLGSLLQGISYVKIRALRRQAGYLNPSGVLIQFRVVELPPQKKCLAVISQITDETFSVETRYGTFPAHKSAMKTKMEPRVGQPVIALLAQLTGFVGATLAPGSPRVLRKQPFSAETIYVSTLYPEVGPDEE